MTPTEAKSWLLTLQLEQREPGRLAFKQAWGDGFLTGAAKLPAKNPFDDPLPVTDEKTVEKPRGKAR